MNDLTYLFDKYNTKWYTQNENIQEQAVREMAEKTMD